MYKIYHACIFSKLYILFLSSGEIDRTNMVDQEFVLSVTTIDESFNDFIVLVGDADIDQKIRHDMGLMPMSLESADGKVIKAIIQLSPNLVGNVAKLTPLNRVLALKWKAPRARLMAFRVLTETDDLRVVLEEAHKKAAGARPQLPFPVPNSERSKAALLRIVEGARRTL